MSSARMVRGTKSRFVLYICAALFLCGLTYLFHNSQTQLDEAKRATAACTQQQESLSAQLQVIFEYKLRLEKSLQKEKAEHKETKDECQNRAQEEKQQREKESAEALNKYNALQQHHKLLQSTHNDLMEECGKVRKAQLDTVEEVSELKNKVASLKVKFQQVVEENNKTVETFKAQYQTLLQQKTDLEKENVRLKENTGPVSERVSRLEMTNKQLENELAQMKVALDQCKASTQSVKASSGGESKVKLPVQDGGPGQDNPNNVAAVAAEPPKVVLTGSSTTPVINPDAVMDHDDPIKQGQKEGFNKSSTSPSLLVPNKPTQEAAAPLVVPDQSNGGLMMEGQPVHQLDNTHQLAPPDSMQLMQQRPMNPVGPMNPVQDDPSKLFVPAGEINRNRMSIENNINNLMEPHVLPDMNGAVEEMEDPQQRQDNEIPRPVRPHEYQGGDYDKEEDDEGEQMDYDGKQPPQQQQPLPQNHNPPQQSHHSHRQVGGGGVMVNPK